MDYGSHDIRTLLNENTRSGAIDASCEVTQEMLRTLERAIEHPDMTEDLAAILSTSNVIVEDELATEVTVR